MAAFILPININQLLNANKPEDDLSLENIIDNVYRKVFVVEENLYSSTVNLDLSNETVTQKLAVADDQAVTNWLSSNGNQPTIEQIMAYMVTKGVLPYGRYTATIH